jgi:hypothetical protein
VTHKASENVTCSESHNERSIKEKTREVDSFETWSQSSGTVLKRSASMSFPYKHSLSRLELHVTVCNCRSCLHRQGRREILRETLNTTVLRPGRVSDIYPNTQGKR